MKFVLIGILSNPAVALVGLLIITGLSFARLWLQLSHRSHYREQLRRTADDLADRGAKDVEIRHGRGGNDVVRFSSAAPSEPLPSESGPGLATITDLAAWREQKRRVVRQALDGSGSKGSSQEIPDGADRP
jgi:hypothetical protein